MGLCCFFLLGTENTTSLHKQNAYTVSCSPVYKKGETFCRGAVMSDVTTYYVCVRATGTVPD